MHVLINRDLMQVCGRFDESDLPKVKQIIAELPHLCIVDKNTKWEEMFSEWELSYFIDNNNLRISMDNFNFSDDKKDFWQPNFFIFYFDFDINEVSWYLSQFCKSLPIDNLKQMRLFPNHFNKTSNSKRLA